MTFEGTSSCHSISAPSRASLRPRRGVGRPMALGRSRYAGLIRSCRGDRAAVMSTKLPGSEHTARPWRIHEIAPDFRIEDVWSYRTPGAGPDDFPVILAALRVAGGLNENLGDRRAVPVMELRPARRRHHRPRPHGGVPPRLDIGATARPGDQAVAANPTSTGADPASGFTMTTASSRPMRPDTTTARRTGSSKSWTVSAAWAWPVRHPGDHTLLPPRVATRRMRFVSWSVTAFVRMFSHLPSSSRGPAMRSARARSQGWRAACRSAGS